MKRLLLTALSALLLCSQTFAVGIDVLPTMQSKSIIQDRVWVGTFQIVWNDFIDRIAFNQIKFPAGTPEIVNELNRQDFTVDELTNRSYYKYVGTIKKNTKKKIEKAIKKKFNETSDLLHQLDLTPGRDRILVYAMLNKKFEFPQAFDNLGASNFRDAHAQFFGINKKSDRDLARNVEVVFYNNSQDYAVKLKTNGKDEVYLYKTNNTNTFNYLYADMLKKEDMYQGEKYLTNDDELKVPYLKFFEEKSFDEVCGKRIKGTNIMIDQAMETIRFEMNNAGVKLKSEGGMTAVVTSLMPQDEIRKFYFDDTFVMFLKEKNKNKPYFALRVYDISRFQGVN